jgi:hypothetical protein
MEQEVVFERFKVSNKLRVIAWITTAMGFLMFAYPVVFILTLIENLDRYNISTVLHYLDKIFFLTVPHIVAAYTPSETNAYIAYAIIYVILAILLMIISNFLLERNLLAIAFCFVIFLSLSIFQYLFNASLFTKLNVELVSYLIFALIPLLLIIIEIIAKKDQLYVQIIVSVMIIVFIMLCFKGLIWLIENKSWLVETLS